MPHAFVATRPWSAKTTAAITARHRPRSRTTTSRWQEAEQTTHRTPSPPVSTATAPSRTRIRRSSWPQAGSRDGVRMWLTAGWRRRIPHAWMVLASSYFGATARNQIRSIPPVPCLPATSGLWGRRTYQRPTKQPRISSAASPRPMEWSCRMPEFAKGVFAARLPASESVPLRLEGGRIIGSASVKPDGSVGIKITDAAVRQGIEETIPPHYSIRKLEPAGG